MNVGFFFFLGRELDGGTLPVSCWGLLLLLLYDDDIDCVSVRVGSVWYPVDAWGILRSNGVVEQSYVGSEQHTSVDSGRWGACMLCWPALYRKAPKFCVKEGKRSQGRRRRRLLQERKKKGPWRKGGRVPG